MGKKEVNPEKFLDRLHALQSEAEGEAEYSLVRYDGEDADGEPVWNSEGAERDYRNRIGGRYGIYCESEGEGRVIKETTITDEGERSLARRQGRRREPDEMTGAAIARAIGELREWSTGLAAQAITKAEKDGSRYEKLLEENFELKAENLQLKVALESKDEIPEGILRILDTGLGLFMGHNMRKAIAAKFPVIGPKLIEAIGYEATVKVAAIIQEEFADNPRDLLTQPEEH